MSLTSIFLLGFLLGIKHATDADHLAAVATLAVGRMGLAQTVRQGLAWGVGHTLTLALFGGMVLLLGQAIPAGMAQALELLAAFMLMALGVDVLRRLVKHKVHFHVHEHQPGSRHVHAHSHAHEPASALPGVKNALHSLQPHPHSHKLPLRALVVGVIHGMAGTAALVLLSLQAVQSVATGLIYIALFGLGSIAGMGLLSVAIAIPLRFSASKQLAWLHQGMTAAVGVFSCALGAVLALRIGLDSGWFS